MTCHHEIFREDQNRDLKVMLKYFGPVVDSNLYDIVAKQNSLAKQRSHLNNRKIKHKSNLYILCISEVFFSESILL